MIKLFKTSYEKRILWRRTILCCSSSSHKIASGPNWICINSFYVDCIFFIIDFKIYKNLKEGLWRICNGKASYNLLGERFKSQIWNLLKKQKILKSNSEKESFKIGNRWKLWNFSNSPFFPKIQLQIHQKLLVLPHR